MAYHISHDISHEYQQPVDIRRIAHPQVSVGAVPPVVEMYAVTPSELHSRRRHQELAGRGISEITFKTEADELCYFAINMGHSRALAAKDLVRICQASFEKSSKVPPEQWMKLRHTTFPFSPLSDDEQQAIKDNIAQITEYALLLGLNVIHICLAIWLLKQREEESPALIIHSGGGDVAIGSTIDKRSGGTYVDSLEYVGAKVISPDEIESYDVLFEPPPKGYYKAITIVLIPESDKWFAFPQHLQYLSSRGVQQVVRNLADAETGEEIGRVLHLLGTLGPIASPAVGQVDTLLEHPSEVVRNVATDVLPDIGGAQVVERLSAVLRDEQRSARSREAAALSLARVGSDEAISELFEQLLSLDASSLVLRLAASHANETLVRQTIQRASQGPEQALSSTVNLFSYISPATLIPTLLDELWTNPDEHVQAFAVVILESLYRRQLRQDQLWGPKIVEILSQSVLSESVVVAEAAFSALTNVTEGHHLSEDEIQLISMALSSPHKDLRYAAVRQMVSRADKHGVELAERAIQREADPAARQQMLDYLETWRAYHKGPTIAEQFLQMLQGLQGYAVAAFKPTLGLLLLMVIGLGLVYLRATVPSLCLIGIAVASLASICLPWLLNTSRETKIVFSLLSLLTIVAIAICAIRACGSKLTLSIQDNFETPNYERWELASSSNVWTGYEDGKLAIVVDEPGTTSWIPMQGNTFQDFDMSVETVIKNGPVDNLYGVLFHYQDADNFYYFVLSGTGYYALMKKESGEWETLVPATPAQFVHLDQNEIRLKVEGKRIQAFLNDQEALNVLEEEDPLEQGTIALAAGTLDDTKAHIAFDNLHLIIFDDQ